ncbi:hypothetical protein M2337_001462 [Sphingobium sp. B2D3A]|uniref:hypothetical protein n=1 Tax=unclassified Sphingobium TaxID=2611147 RepID=UPI00222510CA|nr:MULTISPECIES: hypothetical protein [unclassified Sphingobium]MCW2337229.1 hypothetical protein [Sphingobium sp. B2D3A]MCW2383687.1 hypothetical protein [Sphingobium sp. B2D3D]
MQVRGQANFKNPSQEAGLVYFVERLEELTYEYSLDSYKAPPANPPVLIKEALDQLDAIEATGDEGIGAAAYIVKELADRLKDNIISQSLISQGRDVQNGLSNNDRSSLRSLLQVLTKELSPPAYISKAFELVLSTVPSNKKMDIDFLVTELVATLQNAGMSRRYIYRTTVRYWYDDVGVEKRSISDLAPFLKLIFLYQHEFVVFFKASLLVDELKNENFEAFRIQIQDELDDDFKMAPAAKSFMKRKEKERFVRVAGFKGFDRDSAVESAREKVGLIHNMFRVYHHKQDFQLSRHAMVKQCCESEIVLVDDTDKVMLHVADDRPGAAARRLDNLLRNSAFSRGADKRRFYSIAGFHAMSLEASSLENQIINLWIGLETISPSRVGKTKIDSVVNAIVPCLGLRYLERTMAGAATDLITWDRKAALQHLKAPAPGPERSLAEYLARLLLAADESAVNALFQDLGTNELLRHRLYRLRRNLAEPTKALSLIESHEQRVEWQIRRIYRTRNAIVHKGELPSSVHSVIDSAHFYLDQTIQITNELSCGPQGFHLYRDTFHYLRLEYEAYKRVLRSAGAYGDDVCTGLFWKRPPLLWPKEMFG